MKKIKLTQGKFALVDDEDFEKLNKYKWYSTKPTSLYYAITFINKRNIRMHRFILNPKREEEIDHIDGNGLNNQKINLRICTHSQNMTNHKIRRDNTSGVSGIYWNKCAKKWQAYIGFKNKIIYLGIFKTLKDARESRNLKERALFGEFRRKKNEL